MKANKLKIVIVPAQRCFKWVPVFCVCALDEGKTPEAIHTLWCRPDGVYVLAEGTKKPHKAKQARVLFEVKARDGRYHTEVTDTSGKVHKIDSIECAGLVASALQVHLLGRQEAPDKKGRLVIAQA